MSRYVHKSHNVSLLLYHLVCPAKYRRVLIDASVDAVLREVCLEIATRYEITFLEIGTDGDHVHFLLQSVPSYSPTKIVRLVKSLTAREVFLRCPLALSSREKEVVGRTVLVRGLFHRLSEGYFIASVAQHGNAQTIADYVRGQGTQAQYQQLHAQQLHAQQLQLFDIPT